MICSSCKGNTESSWISAKTNRALNMNKYWPINSLFISIFLLFLLPCCWLHASEQKIKKTYNITTYFMLKLKGSINPGAKLLLERAVKQAEAVDGSALIVKLNTPGGLVSTLRDMVEIVMSARVPIIFFVAPSGAQAASAGAILTLSAHVAAMAPGTNIGAAHPVSLGPGSSKEKGSDVIKKAEHDIAALARSLAAERGRNAKWAEEAVRESVSATAKEAVQLRVVDFIASDVDELIEKCSGRVIILPSGPVKLKTDDAKLIEVKESFREKVLRTIADPNIAYLLLMAGMIGLYFEFAHPGVIFPGSIGAICLLLGLYSLQALSVNSAGLLLLLLAAILFVLELIITSHGILGAAGFAALVFGSIMLFDPDKSGIAISPEVLWPTLVGVGVFMATIIFLATKAALSKPKTGKKALIGLTGVVKKEIPPNGEGLVFVEGELWISTSNVSIPTGEKVKIVDIKGLTLVVEPLMKNQED